MVILHGFMVQLAVSTKVKYWYNVSITQLTSLILSGMLESRSLNRRFLSSGAWFPSTVHVIPPTWASDRCVLSIFRHSWTKWRCSLFEQSVTVTLCTVKQKSSFKTTFFMPWVGNWSFQNIYYVTSCQRRWVNKIAQTAIWFSCKNAISNLIFSK